MIIYERDKFGLSGYPLSFHQKVIRSQRPLICNTRIRLGGVTLSVCLGSVQQALSITLPVRLACLRPREIRCAMVKRVKTPYAGHAHDHKAGVLTCPSVTHLLGKCSQKLSCAWGNASRKHVIPCEVSSALARFGRMDAGGSSYGLALGETCFTESDACVVRSALCCSLKIFADLHGGTP